MHIQEHFHSTLEDSHVIPGLVHKCYLAKSASSPEPLLLILSALDIENNTPFVVAGSGKPLRQFVYSHDLAKMFIWQLREYNDVEPIIFSTAEDDDVSIRYVAEQIVKAFDFRGEVKVGCFYESITSVLTNGFSVRHEQV